MCAFAGLDSLQAQASYVAGFPVSLPLPPAHLLVSYKPLAQAGKQKSAEAAVARDFRRATRALDTPLDE